MHLGALRVELFVCDSNSIKSKRTVIKSLKDRIKNSFNVSVAEVADNDKWQKAVLGIAAVGKDKNYLNGLMDKVLDFLRREKDVQVLDFEMEMI